MDSYEATKMVFSRIQNLDPDNAYKIMGYLLIQDHGEKEMIRLALGPEALIHSLILKAKTHLRRSSTSSSSPRVSSNHINGGFDLTNTNPSSPASTTAPWFSTASSTSLSYANVVNGTSPDNTTSAADHSLSNIAAPLSATALPYYNNSINGNSNNSTDYIDDYQLQDHLSFLNDSKSEEPMFDPRLELALSPTSGGSYGENQLHRSFSMPGMCFGAEDAANSGFGWKPCLYFARGFCKNGTSCRFLHGDNVDNSGVVGSPNKLSNEFLEQHCQELLRAQATAAQQRKLAAAAAAAAAAASQFMASGASFPYNKCMNFLLQQQQDTHRSAAAAATLMIGDDLHKFGRCRPELMNPGSRQIYLTFPADSTFREEDVSNYFSIYGPVQDVRIPYQQKRMFGFVTFVYPETVKLILAKGNPHFVCDSRVLVKPYKEKGKVAEKKQQQQQQQQQMERGDYSACASPSGLDSREPFDLHLGARLFYNTQEMLLRRKLEEQADLQQAIELQGRRLMNLQLLDFKDHPQHHHHHNQYHHHHGLSTGSPIPSPHTPNNNQGLIFQLDGIDQEVYEENNGSTVAAAGSDSDQQLQQEVNPSCNNHNSGNANSSDKDKISITEESDLPESLEHILPDNLFASPKKMGGDHLTTVFSSASTEADDDKTTTPAKSSSSCNNNNNTLVSSSDNTINMPSFKSCFLQMPRLSSGHGTINGM